MSKGVFLFNKNYGLEHSIQPDNLTENYMDANLNGIITGGFTTTDIRDYGQYYYYGVQEDDNFWMYKIRSVVKDNDVIRIHGIHIMYDELQGVVIRDVRPKNKLAGKVLETILDDTDWTVGTVVVSQKFSGNFYYQSSLQSLYELCDKANCEFRPVIKYSQGKIVSKQIELYDQLSGDYGKLFKYGDNLLKVVAETNTDELYTAFIGRGKGEEIYDESGQPTGGYGRKITFKDIDYRNSKDGISVHSPVGQDYIEIKEATALYGYPTGKPRVCEVPFDNIEDKRELADATFDFALENSRPKIQLKATGLQNEKVDLGETVTVIGQLDIRFKTRVFKIKKDFLQEKVISFEFGDKLVKSTADRIKADQIADKEREITEQNYIKAMISMVADTYFNEDGYQYNLEAGNPYDLPAGIYSFDRPIDDTHNPPTKVIYFGAGKLMIAKDKNPDGTWNFSLAMDGEAINANVIRAGILRGGRVEWDLQNGTFKIGGQRVGEKLENPNLYWDGKTLKLRDVDIDLKSNDQIKALNEGISEFRIEQGKISGQISSLASQKGFTWNLLCGSTTTEFTMPVAYPLGKTTHNLSHYDVDMWRLGLPTAHYYQVDLYNNPEGHLYLSKGISTVLKDCTVGKEYTLSFWVKNVGKIVPRICWRAEGRTDLKIISTSEPEQVVYTFTYTGYKFVEIWILSTVDQNIKAGDSMKVILSPIKIEEGRNPEPYWTPCPSEADTSKLSAGFEMTKEEIKTWSQNEIEGVRHELQTKAGQFNSTIYGGGVGLDGKWVYQDDSIASQISQTKEQVRASVKKDDDIIQYINLDTSGATIKADKINLEGATFVDGEFSVNMIENIQDYLEYRSHRFRINPQGIQWQRTYSITPDYTLLFDGGSLRLVNHRGEETRFTGSMVETNQFTSEVMKTDYMMIGNWEINEDSEGWLLFYNKDTKRKFWIHPTKSNEWI